MWYYDYKSITVIYSFINIDQTYWNVLLIHRLYILYVRHDHVMNIVSHIDCRASYDMDHTLQ